MEYIVHYQVHQLYVSIGFKLLKHNNPPTIKDCCGKLFPLVVVPEKYCAGNYREFKLIHIQCVNYKFTLSVKRNLSLLQRDIH